MLRFIYFPEENTKVTSWYNSEVTVEYGINIISVLAGTWINTVLNIHLFYGSIVGNDVSRNELTRGI